MDKNTPLTDVVAHLPVYVCMLLDDKGRSIQELVVRTLRDALIYFEETNCHLDPIQLESVLTFIAQEALTFADMAQTIIEAGFPSAET